MNKHLFVCLLVLGLGLGGCIDSVEAQSNSMQPVDHVSASIRATALVKSLSDPSNEVRANAAENLRRILAADPTVAPNWHDKSYWTERIQKIKPNTLLKDALAILLPNITPKEREAACEVSIGSWNYETSAYRLDDYWHVTLYLILDVAPEKAAGTLILFKAPILEGDVKQQWNDPPKEYTGIWITWYVNGQKAKEIHMNKGKYDGIFTAYYDDGSKAYEQHFIAGVCDGPDTGWYKSGKKMYEGQYKDKQKDGVWRSWYENGQPSLFENYKDGKRDGTSTSWWQNGRKQHEMNFKDDQQDGLDCWWEENGKLLWNRMYRMGKLIESP